MSPLDQDGLDLARDAAEVMMPGRSAQVLWSEVSGDRAIAVVAFDGERRPDLQITLRRTSRRTWKAVGAGQAGDWSQVVLPHGVATRITPVPDGATAARVRHGEAERETPVAHGHVFQALWDVEYHAEWHFGDVVALLVGGGWRALPVAGT